MDCGFFSYFVRVCAFIIPSIILQSWVFSSPYWVKHNEKSECFLGVTKNHGCPDNVEGLGDTIYLLQLISLVITVLAAISTMCYNNYDGFDDDGDNGGFCFCFCSNVLAFGRLMYRLYFIPGFLNFLCCMVVAVNFDKNDKGFPFYLCLVVSCNVIFQMPLFESLRKLKRTTAQTH